MQNQWLVPGRVSGLKPPSGDADDPSPPLIPPDPPDSPLSPHLFPPLPPSATNSPRSTVPLTPRKGSKKISKTAVAPPVSAGSQAPPTKTATTEPICDGQTDSMSGSGKTTVPIFGSFQNPEEIYKTIPSKNSPFKTNKASSQPLTNQHPPPSTNVELPPSVNPSDPPSTPPVTPPVTTDPLKVPPATAFQPNIPPVSPSLVERIRRSEDKTLSRLAPVTISSSGRPRVLIPDSVFQQGAELHKDFIICYFNGKAPPFSQIQRKRLEIHNNPLNRSVLVRIQSDYLKQKILEKYIWYVGDSMFHTAQWSSEHSKSTPPLKAIKIWAHLSGVPLDLRHTKGLSLVAGLVGEPKETDDFTRNLVSLTLSHVKVEVDLTKPLPSIVEFERENGEVVEVAVHYPWVPPTCSHCHELGHIIRNCLLYSPPQTDPPAGTGKKGNQGPVKSAKKYQPVAKASQ
ncbi:hypothetical protein BRARA_D00118, partial [Brassica rapa]